MINTIAPTTLNRALYLSYNLFRTSRASTSSSHGIQHPRTVPTFTRSFHKRGGFKPAARTTAQDGSKVMDEVIIDGRGGVDLAGRFRHDVYAKMMSSPQRKCVITGALLPRDFLICLRPGFIPSSSAPSPPLIPPQDPQNKRTKPKPKPKPECTNNPDPQVNPPRSYLIPDKILYPNSNLMPGRGNWVLCHMNLIQGFVDRKGSHRVLSATAELSRLLPFHVEAQLQDKIILDLQAITIASQAGVASEDSQATSSGEERRSVRSCLVRLSSVEMERIRAGSNEVPGLQTILNLKGLSTASSTAERPHPKTLLDPANRLIYPKIEMRKLYDDPAEIGGIPDKVVPEYPLAGILPFWNHADVIVCLAKVLGQGEDGLKEDHIGVVSTPDTVRTGTPDLGIELSKSLWRSRLYSGQGWSGQHMDEGEKQESVIVAGFQDRMEGKIHAKLHGKLLR